jgi:hypothetical protein
MLEGGVLNINTKLQNEPGQLAVDAGFLYWVDPGMGIVRVPKTTGAPITVVASPGGTSFVLEGDTLYYLALTATTPQYVATLGSVPKAGGTATMIATNLPWATLIAVDAAHVYGGDVTHIASVPKSGGSETTLAAGNSLGAVADAAHVYFIDAFVQGVDHQGISRVPTSGGMRESFAAFAHEFVGFLAIDSSAVYWTYSVGMPNWNGSPLGGAGLAGMLKTGGQRRVFSTEKDALDDVAVSAAGVFVARGPGDYGIERFGADGSAVFVSVGSNRSYRGVRGLVADETGAYAVELDEAVDAIVRVACD